MLHRIINWIVSPFKKKEEVVEVPTTFTLTNSVPLSETTKKQIREDLIEAVKEFKEKHSVDIDTLPLSRVSAEAKEKIVEAIKSDLKEQMEVYPITEEVTINHEVTVTETPKTKKKRYYKKKPKATNNESTISNTKKSSK
jgi:succinyl-CoA synthetase alpha subunit